MANILSPITNIGHAPREQSIPLAIFTNNNLNNLSYESIPNGRGQHKSRPESVNEGNTSPLRTSVKSLKQRERDAVANQSLNFAHMA